MKVHNEIGDKLVSSVKNKVNYERKKMINESLETVIEQYCKRLDSVNASKSISPMLLKNQFGTINLAEMDRIHTKLEQKMQAKQNPKPQPEEKNLAKAKARMLYLKQMKKQEELIYGLHRMTQKPELKRF